MPIDYTAKDFETAKSFFLSHAKDRLKDKVKNVEDAELLGVLIELFSLVWDMLSFYQDRQAQEVFLTEAITRPAVVSGAKALGYTLASARPASVEAVLGVDPPLDSDGLIKKGSLATAEGLDGTIYFELMNDRTLFAGLTEMVIDMVEGRTIHESYTANREPFQVYELQQAPYIDGTLNILVASGGGWTQVDGFEASGSGDKHYTVEVQEDGKATVQFGDGVNGMAPEGIVELSYRIGGGKRGQVPPGAISQWLGSITVGGVPANVNVSITNPEKAVGGADQESLQEAKFNAPLSVKTNDRTIALEDYQINARIPGVIRVMAANYEKDAAILINTVLIYVIPSGDPSVFPPALKEAVEYELTVTKPRSATARIDIRLSKYVEPEFVGTVFVRKGYDIDAVRRAVEEAFSGMEGSGGFFDHLRRDETGDYALDWGKTAALSEIYAWFQKVAGVRRVDLTQLVLGDPPGNIILPYDLILKRGANTMTGLTYVFEP